MDLLIPIGLVLLGLALIAVEVYLVPGFNVVGILGTLMLVFAVGFVFSTNGMLAGTLALFIIVAMGGGLGYVAWRSGAWERFVLAASLQRDAELDDKTQENRARYLGKVGQAMTPLRPTGVAEIEGERVEVMTEGGFISAGSAVRVVAMDRRHLFVRLAALPSSTGSSTVTKVS